MVVGKKTFIVTGPGGSGTARGRINSVSAPSSVESGEAFTVSISVTNTGDALGRFQDEIEVAEQTVRNNNVYEADPNETITIRHTIALSGVFVRETFRLIAKLIRYEADGSQHEDDTEPFNVTVNPAPAELNVAPRNIPQDSDYTVFVANFLPGERVTVYLRDSNQTFDIFSFNVQSSGPAAGQAIIQRLMPFAPPGRYTLQAIGQESDKESNIIAIDVLPAVDEGPSVITLNTNKSSYVGLENIQVTGDVNQLYNPGEGDALIMVYAPGGQLYRIDVIPVGSNGQFSYSFVLGGPIAGSGGTFKIEVHYAGQKAEKSITWRQA